MSRSSLFPVISKLHLGFFRPLQEQAAAGPTANAAAFDSYMRGRQLLDEYSQSSVEAAVSYLRRATEEDPLFALG